MKDEQRNPLSLREITAYEAHRITPQLSVRAKEVLSLVIYNTFLITEGQSPTQTQNETKTVCPYYFTYVGPY